MTEKLNPKEFFIPITLATGIACVDEAGMLLRYTGYSPVLIDGDKKERISLGQAIEWNKSEVLSSTGIEKTYREAMVKELAGLVHLDSPFSEETLVLQAKVYPEQAKAFYDSEKKNLSERALRILKTAEII